jgi:2'-5' RNA ligase
MSPLPTQMTTHWWQRPGRLPGRELYHWHMLFHDQPKVHELVAIAQKKLAGQPGLDMIEIPWLHMTTYIVGFADEVPDSAIEAMTTDVRRRLSQVAPIRVSLGRVGYASNAIVLPVEPLDALSPILDAVRGATRATGCEGHTDTDPWLPHISVAYSNTTMPAAPIIAALGRWLPKTEITIRSINLVSQTQVGRSWQWRPVAEVHLTGELVPPR